VSGTTNRNQANCCAKTRAGTECQRSPLRGRRRCRLHGGLSPGAPRGAKNGNFRSGNWTAEPVAERRWLRSLVRSFSTAGWATMNKPNNSPAPLDSQRRLPPVRVKVFPADGKIAPVGPPDGEAANWWQRLNKALGTTSSDFVSASLYQIQAACHSPYGGISNSP
jgi:hypothetical protein